MALEEPTRLFGAVLAGEQGDIDRCVGSFRRQSMPVEIFDTTAEARHRRLEGAGVTVTPVAWPGSFAEARNAGIERLLARGVRGHALWVDTDEFVLGRAAAALDAAVRSGWDGEEPLCPVISDSEFSTTGVARLHRIDSGLRFHGKVHEYLVRPDGESARYQPCTLEVRHDGYGTWDRVERNDGLLRQQLEVDADNPRWRPFLVRDAAARMEPPAIARVIRAQAALGVSYGVIGGVSSDDYTRMIAWHGSWHFLSRSRSPILLAALARLDWRSERIGSELLYLRLVAGVITGVQDDLLLDQAFQVRRGMLAREEDVPWLDAGISVALEALGRGADAEAYRAESTPFTDPFCEDSRLRPLFAEVPQSSGAFARR